MMSQVPNLTEAARCHVLPVRMEIPVSNYRTATYSSIVSSTVFIISATQLALKVVCIRFPLESILSLKLHFRSPQATSVAYSVLHM